MTTPALKEDQKKNPPQPERPDRLRASLLSQLGSKVFSIMVAICIGGWTARYLGPSDLGKLSYVSALVGILGPLGSLEARGSLSALLCEANILSGLLSTAFCIELIGTVLLGVAVVPFAILSRDPLIITLFGLAVIANLFNSSEVFEAELLSRHRGSLVARSSFLQTVTGGFFSTIALMAQAPLVVFGALQVLQSATRAILLYKASATKLSKAWLQSASWATARRLIQRGWPMMISGFAIMIYMQSDQVMLQWMRSSEEVGQYSVAVRVASSLYFAPLVLRDTFLPRLKMSSRELTSDCVQLYRFSWLLGAAITLATAFILPQFLLLAFGNKYQDSLIALSWLAPSGFAVSMTFASGAWLVANNFEKILAKRAAIGALINIFLNFALIPAYGIKGAAIATSISQLIAANILQLLDSRTRKNQILLLFPFTATQSAKVAPTQNNSGRFE